MDVFACLSIFATIIFATTSAAFSNLDTKNLSNKPSRFKRECLTSFRYESSSQLPRIPGRSNCVLPEHPDGGKWIIFDGPRKFPGQIVPAKTVLQYQCNQQFKLLPEIEFSVCHRFWSMEPICLKTCPSLTSTREMHVSCKIDNKDTSCTDAYDGALARATCASSQLDRYLKCSNGVWNSSLPTCKPGNECKFQYPDINDEAKKFAVLGEFPFMALIGFQQASRSSLHFMCPGALISKYYVISWASCAGIPDSAPVAVRFGSIGLATNQSEIQDVKIKRVIVHRDYRPSILLAENNIALIKLEKQVTLNAHVQPISIIEPETIDSVKIVVGWTYEDLDNGAGFLQKSLATMFVDDCKNHIREFRDSIWTWDDKLQCLQLPGSSNDSEMVSPVGVVVTANKDAPCKYSLENFYMFTTIKEGAIITFKLYPYLGWINSIIDKCEC